MLTLANRLLREPVLFLSFVATAAVVLLPAEVANPIVAFCVMGARNSVKSLVPKRK